jgi:hypothetical protein
MFTNSEHNEIMYKRASAYSIAPLRSTFEILFSFPPLNLEWKPCGKSGRALRGLYLGRCVSYPPALNWNILT